MPKRSFFGAGPAPCRTTPTRRSWDESGALAGRSGISCGGLCKVSFSIKELLNEKSALCERSFFGAGPAPCRTTPTRRSWDEGGALAGRSGTSCGALYKVSISIKELVNEKYSLCRQGPFWWWTGTVRVDVDALESGRRRRLRWSFWKVLRWITDRQFVN